MLGVRKDDVSSGFDAKETNPHLRTSTRRRPSNARRAGHSIPNRSECNIMGLGQAVGGGGATCASVFENVAVTTADAGEITRERD